MDNNKDDGSARFILIKPVIGTPFKIGYNPNHTVREVKEVIFQKIQLPVKEQRLLCAGTILGDNRKKLSADYGVLKNNTIILQAIKPNSDQESSDSEHPEEEEEIEKGYYDQSSRSRKEEQLVYERPRNDLVEPKKVPMKAAYIRIFVNLPNEKMLSFELDPSDTIMKLKNKIRDQEDILIESQTLLFNGIPLRNDKTVGYSGLRDQDELELIVNKPRKETLTLTVNLNNGKTITVNADPADPVEKIEKACRDSSRLTGSLMLESGRELERGNRLSNYGITKSAILYFM